MSGNTAVIPQIEGAAVPAPAIAAPVVPAAPTTGAASALQQQAPPPRDNFAPRKFAAPAPSGSSGQPDLLRLVATQPYHTVQQLATSTYIPSTHNFFRVAHAMDTQMMLTHKFIQSNPHWHPFITQLYISFLVYIHIIRCMIEDNPMNRVLVEFYDIIHRHIGLDSLIVPGPIVPLLAAITTCSSPHEWIGNIAPTLPSNTGASARNGYRLNNRIYMCLPSIPFICDQVHTLTALVNSTIADATAQANYATFATQIRTVFGQAPSSNRPAWYNAFTPNAMYYVHVPYANARRFADLSANLIIPSFPMSGNAADNTSMDYFQFFGFTPYGNGIAHNWLSTVGPIMSSYSQFFQGSSSLLSISPTGLGASIPVAMFSATSGIIPVHERLTDAVAAAPAGPNNNPPATVGVAAFVARQTALSNEATLHHAAPALSELAEQYSALALVNCDFTDVAAASADLNGPDNAHLRSGPYWSLPKVRETGLVNTAPGIAMNIAAHYHSATAIRR